MDARDGPGLRGRGASGLDEGTPRPVPGLPDGPPVGPRLRRPRRDLAAPGRAESSSDPDPRRRNVRDARRGTVRDSGGSRRRRHRLPARVRGDRGRIRRGGADRRSARRRPSPRSRGRSSPLESRSHGGARATGRRAGGARRLEGEASSAPRSRHARTRRRASAEGRGDGTAATAEADDDSERRKPTTKRRKTR